MRQLSFAVDIETGGSVQDMPVGPAVCGCLAASVLSAHAESAMLRFPSMSDDQGAHFRREVGVVRVDAERLAEELAQRRVQFEGGRLHDARNYALRGRALSRRYLAEFVARPLEQGA